MNALKDAFLKAFDPRIAVKITSLDDSVHVEKILRKIHAFLKKGHTVLLDELENTIYIEK